LKGIEKKKKSRMVFDEEKDEYAPRWGYKRANNESENVIIEHREGDDPSIDPWARLKHEKKARVEKNTKQQERNLKSASGQRVPGTIDLTSTVNQANKPTFSEKKASKNAAKQDRVHHVDMALKLVQKSTASMGKFDSERRGEKKSREKTAESTPNTQIDARAEKARSMSVLNKLLGKSESDGERFSLEKAAGVGQREKEYQNVASNNKNNNKRKRN
jgi:regulator of ribosome biosynthesis